MFTIGMFVGFVVGAALGFMIGISDPSKIKNNHNNQLGPAIQAGP